MHTAADIITSLSGKTKMLGWDTVVAYYDRNTIQFENITLSHPVFHSWMSPQKLLAPSRLSLK